MHSLFALRRPSLAADVRYFVFPRLMGRGFAIQICAGCGQLVQSLSDDGDLRCCLPFNAAASGISLD
jgi:hypothetical protein